jgi:hypothetical protein
MANRENLGRVGYWHRSFLTRCEYQLKRIVFRGSGGLWSVRFTAAMPHYAREPGFVWLVPALSLLPAFLTTIQVNSGRAMVTNRIHGRGTEPLNQGWGPGAVSATSTGLSTGVDAGGNASGTRTRTTHFRYCRSDLPRPLRTLSSPLPHRS